MRASLVTVFLLLLAGCAVPEHGVLEHEIAGTPDGYSVTLHTVPEQPLPGSEVTVHVAIKDVDGSPAELGIVHEKPLHVMIIRDDLQHFAHLHADEPAETFTLTHVFPEPGSYRAMIEFTAAGTTMAIPKDVTVLGDYAPQPLSGTFSRDWTDGRYRVSLAAPQEIAAGTPTLLAFSIMEGDLPVDDLDKFLGEDMHLAIWQEGLRHFEHAHPVRDRKLAFQAVFPTPGVYKLYSQFQHQGTVVTAEFLVKVG